VTPDLQGPGAPARGDHGNPEGGDYHPVAFGGYLDEDRKFGPLTIPTRMRVGWYFGSERFETEGEFFRATVEAAEFR